MSYDSSGSHKVTNEWLESVAEAEYQMQEHIARLTDALDSAVECALAGDTPTPEQVKGWAVVLGERAKRHGFGAEERKAEGPE